MNTEYTSPETKFSWIVKKAITAQLMGNFRPSTVFGWNYKRQSKTWEVTLSDKIDPVWKSVKRMINRRGCGKIESACIFARNGTLAGAPMYYIKRIEGEKTEITNYMK